MKTKVSGMSLALLVTHRLLYGDLKEHRRVGYNTGIIHFSYNKFWQHIKIWSTQANCAELGLC